MAVDNGTLSFVDTKLREWNLADYIQIFKEHQIDEHTFLSMKEYQVVKLIPLIGPQTIFLEKRLEYLKLKNLNDLDPQLDLDDTLSVTSSFTFTTDEESPNDSEQLSKTSLSKTDQEKRDKGERLIKLLKTCERTQVLLSAVRLTQRDRRTLCGIIVDHLLSKKEKVTACDFEFWANQIPLVFRHELAASYYQPYRGGPNKRLASGKLWDRYNNEKKHIRPQKTASICGQRSVASRPVVTEEIEAALVKLRAISPEDTDVRNLWRLTAGYRDKDVSISDYYQQYPILGTTIGSSLIHIDFEVAGLVPDPNILIKTWADTARKILQLAKQRGICKDLFNRREQSTAETLGFIVLPYLFRTSQLRTKNRSVWRPSQPEVAEAFIMQITGMGDYEKRIDERRAKLYKYGLTIQPFVLTVGTATTYTAIYVVVGETKYECSSLMGAVDLCYKATWALNAEYQTDCEAVWNFIERFVYKMTENTKSQKSFQSVQTVVSDIQSLSSEQ